MLLVLSLIWTSMLIVDVGRRAGSGASRSTRRFLVAPVLVVIVFVLARYDVPLEARWAASQPSFQQAADSVLDGRSLGAGEQRFGAYWVDEVRITEGMVVFVIGQGPWTESGFLYAPDASVVPEEHIGVGGLGPRLGDGWCAYSMSVDWIGVGLARHQGQPGVVQSRSPCPPTATCAVC